MTDPPQNPQPTPTPGEFVDRRSEAHNRRQSTARVLLGSLIVVAVLYLARQFFIPLALAVLFAFLLRPMVARLERFLPRVVSVLAALAITLTILGAGAWALYGQSVSLAHEVASYSGNLEQKLSIFRSSPDGPFAALERTLQRITESAETDSGPDLKVTVVEGNTLGERYARLAPSIEAVATAFLVVFLVFFLLMDREQIRDRVLRVAGRAHLTVTTQAIGETTERISRYLLTILALNVSFGILIGIGLFLMGVPHALLWGVLAAVLRFVPYIGAVLSAALPTFLALAVSPGWLLPLGVMALFLIADQILAGLVEPAVVGHRVGVSPIALLLAAIFWGWLWGPVGLLLATPITVVLTASGEFIPGLRIFTILFADEAPLENYLSFYNRLLLRDRVGAWRLAERYAEQQSMQDAFVDLFIPTLAFSTDEMQRRRITRAQDNFIKDTIRELIIRIGDRWADNADGSGRRFVASGTNAQRLSFSMLMLSQLLRSQGDSVDNVSDVTGEELGDYVDEVVPVALLLSCTRPADLEAGLRTVQYIRERFPRLEIIVGGSGFATGSQAAMDAGASLVVSSLDEALSRLSNMRRAA